MIEHQGFRDAGYPVGEALPAFVSTKKPIGFISQNSGGHTVCRKPRL